MKWKWSKCCNPEGESRIDLIRCSDEELLLCCETWMIDKDGLDLIEKAPQLQAENEQLQAELEIQRDLTRRYSAEIDTQAKEIARLKEFLKVEQALKGGE